MEVIILSLCGEFSTTLTGLQGQMEMCSPPLQADLLSFALLSVHTSACAPISAKFSLTSGKVNSSPPAPTKQGRFGEGKSRASEAVNLI